MVLLILKGIPASGKTTFARDWVMRDPETRVRVNLDDLRLMSGPYMVNLKRESLFRSQDLIVEQHLIHGLDVVLDNTNFTFDSSRLEAKFPHLKVVTHFLDTPLEECILRDSKREKPVGAEVITSIYNRYVNTTNKEG